MDDLRRHYQVLEVPYGAPLEEIQRKYRDLAVIWHPDRFVNNPRLQAMALEKLKEINGAYHELSRYVKEHGPPPADPRNKRKEHIAEKLAREKVRAEWEAKAWAEARARSEREKQATQEAAAFRSRATPGLGAARKKRRRVIWMLVAAAFLVAGIVAALVLAPDKRTVRQPVAAPAPSAVPASGIHSSPSPGPSGTARLPELPPFKPSKPASRAVPPSVALPATVPLPQPPPHLPAQPDHAPEFIRSVNLDQVYARCIRHSPADWCTTVTDHCRDYLKDCRKLSETDQSYQESSACRGVSEWCHKSPQRVINVVPELDDRVTNMAE